MTRAEVVALVNLADDFEFAKVFRADETSAWPMRPFEPVMMILVICRENVMRET